jgi:hypothetical protein
MRLRTGWALGMAILAVACGKEEPTTPRYDVTGGGVTVTSNKLVSASSTDFCTEYAGEECYFRGGQRVVFGDGSVLLTGGWLFAYTSGGGDTDSNEHSISAFLPSGLTASQQTLSQFVARGASYKAAFLVYDRASDGIGVVHDANGNGTADAGDTLLFTATLSDW